MKDYKTASKTVVSSIALFVILGLVMSGLIVFFAPTISSVMNAPEDAFGDTVGYIRICGMGILCIVLFNAVSGMLRGIGDSKTPLTLMGIACAANILGDLLLVGVFSMGSDGAVKRRGLVFETDPAVCAAAANYLRSYAVDYIIIGFNFSMMGYLNGLGKTGFVALQGILSTFLVRIPVSFFMSKIPGVSLFQVGFATPLATVFAIIITILYLRM